MKIATFALTLTVFGALGLVGCNSSDSAAPAATDVASGGMAPGGMAPGATTPGAMAAPGGGIVPNGGPGGTAPAGKAGRSTSFDGAPEAMKKLFQAAGGGDPMAGGGMPGGSGSSGSKPAPIRIGMLPVASRRDPFESVVKSVVQITPAWDYVMNHRTEAPFVPTPTPPKDQDPSELPPLLPVPRRVAGVFYNGGITAIIESGTPPSSEISIVQPGAEVDSLIPGVPPLVVESISMESLILRARDGRSVEVKLSGLSPAVRGALSQQFSSGTGGGMGDQSGMGMGAQGMGAPGGGGKSGGGVGGAQ